MCVCTKKLYGASNCDIVSVIHILRQLFPIASKSYTFNSNQMTKKTTNYIRQHVVLGERKKCHFKHSLPQFVLRSKDFLMVHMARKFKIYPPNTTFLWENGVFSYFVNLTSDITDFILSIHHNSIPHTSLTDISSYHFA